MMHDHDETDGFVEPAQYVLRQGLQSCLVFGKISNEGRAFTDEFRDALTQRAFLFGKLTAGNEYGFAACCHEINSLPNQFGFSAISRIFNSSHRESGSPQTLVCARLKRSHSIPLYV